MFLKKLYIRMFFIVCWYRFFSYYFYYLYLLYLFWCF